MKKVLGAAAAAALAVSAIAASPAAAFTPLNPDMMPAMQQDLGLTYDQAVAALATENAASTLSESLTAALGDTFAGSYYDATTKRLHVDVTDASKLDQVKAAGADAGVARFSATQLNSTVDRLNSAEATAPKSVTTWGVDSKTNRVTVTVEPGKAGDVDSYLAKTGVDKGAVTVVESADRPSLQYDVRGGDAYYIANRARCSIGFSVTGGFVSAGHCAAIGSSLTGYNQVAMGSFSRYSFPTNDYSLARTNSNWTPRGVINNGTRVAGSTEAATGTSACKSGSTTGWTCGTIGAKNQTVRYAEGTVYGMTATNIHSEGGDSGGSIIAGNQGQGLLSGGNSTTMYFFPLNKALSALGATLIRG
ncbi:streptogrisin C [Amycolatopsis xylanica]|uniref:Streptogrisin C n=1 Tax=Amycolatopsis xylanica TaxID=589385 RepID=A0A1H3SPW9_9PSEU|nr:S1 family peptidase [Amycolatopsis xylanica]SDZ40046.1 streptogrisin C [Amycolatopsis xylanica]